MPSDNESNDEDDQNEIMISEHQSNLDKIIQHLDRMKDLVFNKTDLNSFAEYLRNLKQ